MASNGKEPTSDEPFNELRNEVQQSVQDSGDLIKLFILWALDFEGYEIASGKVNKIF